MNSALRICIIQVSCLFTWLIMTALKGENFVAVYILTVLEDSLFVLT